MHVHIRERKASHVGEEPGGLLALTVSFLFGTAAALAASHIWGVEGVQLRLVLSGGYWQALWNCSLFLIVLVFLAGCIWGSALIPALTAVRGYVLTSAAMAVAVSDPGGGALAWLSVGIPAMITVPCFFILAADCAVCSRRLAAAGSGRPAPVPPAPLLRHCLLCVPALAGAAALEVFVLPLLGSGLLG